MKGKLQHIAPILGGVIFLSLGIAYSFYRKGNLESLNKEYFESFNESFEGKITRVENQYSVHHCMLFINLTKSTTQTYDVRKSTDEYYTVIKDDKAEVIEQIRYGRDGDGESQNRIHPDDYFIFNGIKDSVYLFRDNHLIDSWKPMINNFPAFPIKNKHEIKE